MLQTILSKHENDFKTYTMRGLACRELRAIMGSLPEFKKNQTVQIEVDIPYRLHMVDAGCISRRLWILCIARSRLQWKERLANKIDEAEVAEQKAASAPAAPPKACATLQRGSLNDVIAQPCSW
jgi:hypothetical protein